ncbi:MAG: tRNA dihydrouridine synthase DusB [Clostridiaceae bacterium]|nr:tRNA dihydrouridine synthase DusB [Clostridiaceae bacterium]
MESKNAESKEFALFKSISVSLAPMAGTSSVAFRNICHRYGADYSTTELVSARGIAYKQSVEPSFRYLEQDPLVGGPCAIQLFGYDPEDFSRAVPIIFEDPRLAGAMSIDINMGCPVPKVVKTGAGSALMKNKLLASHIIEATVRACEPYQKPVSVKFRKGWDESQSDTVGFAKMCIDSGAKVLTLHARTRDQMYHGKADWNCIASVKSAIAHTGIPLIGNGDVTDGTSAKAMMELTGVEGVAVGRAAQGNPFIFSQIRAFLDGRESAVFVPTPEERVSVMLEHLAGLISRIGEIQACKEMRSQIAYYFKGQRFASEYKAAAMSAESYDEVRCITEQWLERVQGAGER